MQSACHQETVRIKGQALCVSRRARAGHLCLCRRLTSAEGPSPSQAAKSRPHLKGSIGGENAKGSNRADTGHGLQAPRCCSLLGQHVDRLLQCRETAAQLFDLVKSAADVADQIRQVCTLVLDDLCQTWQVADALRNNITELLEVRAQRIHPFGSLIHELLSGAKHDSPGLLLLGLRFDKARCRSLRCFDDRLRFGDVVLLPLDGRFGT